MTGRVFGVWDAPATDDDLPIAAPVGQPCMYCRELIQDGDNGRIQENGFVVHRECSLRSAMGGIGHCVDHDRYCRSDLGPDAGLGYRASAMMVWNWFQLTRMHPTEAQRSYWKKVLALAIGQAGGELSPLDTTPDPEGVDPPKAQDPPG